MPDVELIVIGNELLIGEVQDTNTYWLCRQLSAIGGWVRRVVTIGDDVETIAGEILSALGQSPALLILGGGLGPTDDDLTLIALSKATQRPLQLNERALEMVSAKYELLAQAGHVASSELNAARKKMAMLPQGSEPLDNPVGAAPGVLLKISTGAFKPETYIVSLPGVPDELKGIFETSLTPILQQLFGTGAACLKTVIVNCGDESVLAESLSTVTARHPRVYVKSHARKYGEDIQLKVTLRAAGKDSHEAESLIESAVVDLAKQLATCSITVHEIL